MRIAMIGQKTSVANVGGVEGHVAHLAAGLVERGHEVTVFTRGRYGAPAPSNVEIRERWCIPLKHFEAISHSTLCSLESVVSGFDIVHYHGVGPALTVPLAGLRRRTSVCVTVHDQDYNKHKWSGFARYWLRAGERTACKHADNVIVVARYLERHMLAAHERATHYIPNGYVPEPRLPPGDVLVSHGLEPQRYLLFLARLVPEKGCDVLIEAIRRTDSPYRVAIVGGLSHSTAYGASLRELAAGDPRFTFLGHQSGDALAEIRANAAYYVMPSFQEGLPLSLLEALSAGLPVIASDIPAVHEVDGTVSPDRITLVPPGDATALAGVVEQLPFPGNQPLEHGISWPSWREVAAEVEGVYLGAPRVVAEPAAVRA
jgi:glycosyltransferase involved in cell wall biosynthesis